VGSPTEKGSVGEVAGCSVSEMHGSRHGWAAGCMEAVQGLSAGRMKWCRARRSGRSSQAGHGPSRTGHGHGGQHSGAWRSPVAHGGRPEGSAVSHPVLRPNRMLRVCVHRNQVYTHTVRKMGTE
jgi:hypothetical protein